MHSHPVVGSHRIYDRIVAELLYIYTTDSITVGNGGIESIVCRFSYTNELYKSNAAHCYLYNNHSSIASHIQCSKPQLLCHHSEIEYIYYLKMDGA